MESSSLPNRGSIGLDNGRTENVEGGARHARGESSSNNDKLKFEVH